MPDPGTRDMAAYYQARAREYEAIYDKPERQRDLAALKTWLVQETRGRHVLEVACGTGYWTAVAAPGARAILATDINAGPIEIARAKRLGGHVSFVAADAYALPEVPGADTVMAHFWWSHVAIAEQPRFLAHVAARLPRGGKLLMIDNRYVEGSSTSVSRRDAAGNTYQMRTLANGSRYEVLKNFPDRAQLEAALHQIAARAEVLELDYFWAIRAELD